MKNQKHLFQLPEDIHYLNAAYMSPLLKSVEEAGIAALIQKRNPAKFQPTDFFDPAEKLKKNFGKLINSPSEQVAIIPSASYGLKTAINNLPTDNGNTALIISEEFPSGYYALERWCRENNKNLQTIKTPESLLNRGKEWNELILSNINEDTAVVVMSAIHWTDGTLFDLKAIGKRCKEHNVLFIADGTQSVGALPMDVALFQIDALICAGYKWLLGPYSIGMAYFSEHFNQGIPLEESWMNRSNAREFSGLTDYAADYTRGAGRYNVGEYSNFNLLPMLNVALEQLLEWKVEVIQEYCDNITKPLVDFLKENNFWVEEEEFRAKHLFGFQLPPDVSLERLMKKLQEKNIYVSVRGKAIRISTHLYNSEEDIQELIYVLRKL